MVSETRQGPPWTFGDRIRRVRRSMQLEQSELAALLGVTRGALAQWETDMAQPRDLRARVAQLEQVTGVHHSWWLGYGVDASQSAA